MEDVEEAAGQFTAEQRSDVKSTSVVVSDPVSNFPQLEQELAKTKEV